MVRNFIKESAKTIAWLGITIYIIVDKLLPDKTE